jgi:hypothetical protein
MQRPFIDNPAARGVDEIGGLFHALQPRRGDDPKVIARRLLREKRNAPSGFYGPISYRTH